PLGAKSRHPGWERLFQSLPRRRWADDLIDGPKDRLPRVVEALDPDPVSEPQVRGRGFAGRQDFKCAPLKQTGRTLAFVAVGHCANAYDRTCSNVARSGQMRD